MNNIWVGNIIRFVVLILLQVLVINKISLMDGYVLPYIYIFAILMLPFETPRLAVLGIAFTTGLIVDSFTNTLGMHIVAATLLGFLQPSMAQILSPRDGYEFGDRPTVQSQGLPWYLIYAGVLTLVHHVVLFFVEIFRFSPFFFTLGKGLLSACFTLLLMLIGQYLIYKPATREPR